MSAPSIPSVNLTLPEVVRQHFEDQKKPVRAIPTPLPKWNKYCRDEGGGQGVAFGWHITVAGATGHGKSLMALNMGARAMWAGYGVGFLSFEMSRAQLATRLFALSTGVSVRHLERGTLKATAAEAVEERIAEVGGTFHTNDQHLRSIDEGMDLMQWWMEERGVKMFVVDYMQLAVPRGSAMDERQAVGYVSSLVRDFAAEHGVVTVGLCQFNRGTSGNRYESPTVEGLKSTSALEQDSDQVVMLDHSRYEKDEAKSGARTWAIIGKNRHGSKGQIPIYWDYETLKVREGLPDEEDAWPKHEHEA